MMGVGIEEVDVYGTEKQAVDGAAGMISVKTLHFFSKVWGSRDPINKEREDFESQVRINRTWHKRPSNIVLG
jgi:hypothetical protein